MKRLTFFLICGVLSTTFYAQSEKYRIEVEAGIGLMFPREWEHAAAISTVIEPRINLSHHWAFGLRVETGIVSVGRDAKYRLGPGPFTSPYFRQPVLNDHILMAQRLADESDDPETRKAAYAKIIDSVTALISATASDE